MNEKRILVVDHSVVARRVLTDAISADSELEVVGSASNGRIALAKIAQLAPDLVTLDVDMPEMDGLETLRAIRKQYPHLPVVMYSALTERGAATTIDALLLGANDYVTKPTNMGSAAVTIEHIRNELIPKIKTYSAAARPDISSVRASMRRVDVRQPWVPARGRRPGERVDVIAVGASTGGPNALAELLAEFPASLPVPVLIVQHMPPMFTTLLAQRLASRSHIRVGEANSDETLEPRRAWLAPGDFHMVVERNGGAVRIRTHQGPPENSCRPSVDVLFRSVAEVYGPHALAVVMTGMGQDGLRGCEYVHKAGSQIIVQDEASSVVWGMPGLVANAGLADKILPLDHLAYEIQTRVREGRQSGSAA